MAFKLNDCQEKAIRALISFLLDPNQHEYVLEGYAGTGKTTLISHFLANLDKYQESYELLGHKWPTFEKTAITATTRKAARVLAETMDIEPLTIHSHLGLILRNNWGDGTTSLELSGKAEQLSNQFIIIDEASFIDDELKNYINYLAGDCKVLYMGDPAQLISVNAEKSPIFDAGIPTVRLKTVMRNNGTISELAKQYRETVESGIFKPPITDGYAVKHVTPEEFEDDICNTFRHHKFVPDKSAKVVAWTNNRVSAYNAFIRECRGVSEMITEGETLITNKPIMESNSEMVCYGTDVPVKVKNVTLTHMEGIQGYMVDLEKRKDLFVPIERWRVNVLMKRLAKEKKWKEYFHVKDQWGDLRPAYASTVHKSQGSTYDKVFIDLTDIGTCEEADAVARLLYVAVSRPSTQIVMCGELPPRWLGQEPIDVKSALTQSLLES
ncbi:MAG: hypothetical protein AXW14_15450 [Alteromonas sp. Nap_26]|nr:MAG: hypothetical protein AXW14_15450 [Alteromonas sp. Nap_26]